MRANYQYLQSICPDPMMLTVRPAYKVNEFSTPDFATLEVLDETTDQKRFRAKLEQRQSSSDEDEKEADGRTRISISTDSIDVLTSTKRNFDGVSKIHCNPTIYWDCLM